jgi:hypothetical protein
VNGMKNTINISGERYSRMQVLYCSSAQRRHNSDDNYEVVRTA